MVGRGETKGSQRMDDRGIYLLETPVEKSAVELCGKNGRGVTQKHLNVTSQ